MVKNWLITGGCGFIGTNLIKKLVNEGGHFIRVLDNISVGTRADLAEVTEFSETLASDLTPMNLESDGINCELVEGDMLDEKLAAKVCEGAEIIVHLAANTGVAQSVEDPRKDCMMNVIGTLNMLEGARKQNVERFIFASSGAPIGECNPPIHEELAPHPVSPYGASKLAGEAYCSAYARTFRIHTVALRFGNVYGSNSGHKSSVVAKFIRRAIQGKPLEIYGDGKQTRDFIYIDDLTRAIELAAVTEGIDGEVFQIATNAETTVDEIVDNLLPLLSEAGIKNVDVVHRAPRIGDVKRNFSETSKAEKMLGWRAEIALSNGLRRTVDWFINIKYKQNCK